MAPDGIQRNHRALKWCSKGNVINMARYNRKRGNPVWKQAARGDKLSKLRHSLDMQKARMVRGLGSIGFIEARARLEGYLLAHDERMMAA